MKQASARVSLKTITGTVQRRIRAFPTQFRWMRVTLSRFQIRWVANLQQEINCLRMAHNNQLARQVEIGRVAIALETAEMSPVKNTRAQSLPNLDHPSLTGVRISTHMRSIAVALTEHSAVWSKGSHRALRFNWLRSRKMEKKMEALIQAVS